MSTSQASRHLAVLFLAIAAGVPFARAGEPAAAVPAYPASLRSDCNAGACTEAPRDEHAFTFISRLSFPSGSAMLTREAKNELLRMLMELESFAVIKHVEIVAHADPSGPEDFNRWITAVRAARVEDYFRQSGVDPRKISVRGAGSGEPLSGAIDESEHRRVEVRVTLQPFL